MMRRLLLVSLLGVPALIAGSFEALACGNSHHRVFLPPQQYWSFVAPVYSGSLATEMRFVLYPGSDRPVYSNQFPGFVNPEQFAPPPGPDFSVFEEMNEVSAASQP